MSETPDEKGVIRHLCAVIFASIISAFVALPDSMKLLFAVMLADLVVGVARAITEGGWSGEKSWKGALRKATALTLCAVAYGVQRYLHLQAPLVEATALFFVWHFGTSLMGNAIALGLPVPAGLKAAFEALGEKQQPTPTPKISLPEDPPSEPPVHQP